MAGEAIATVYLGAEGCSEVEGKPWIRAATDEEAQAAVEEYEAYCAEHRRFTVDLKFDDSGRPYWPMTVLEGAPLGIIEQAKESFRRLRFS